MTVSGPVNIDKRSAQWLAQHRDDLIASSPDISLLLHELSLSVPEVSLVRNFIEGSLHSERTAFLHLVLLQELELGHYHHFLRRLELILVIVFTKLFADSLILKKVRHVVVKAGLQLRLFLRATMGPSDANIGFTSEAGLFIVVSHLT